MDSPINLVKLGHKWSYLRSKVSSNLYNMQKSTNILRLWSISTSVMCTFQANLPGPPSSQWWGMGTPRRQFTSYQGRCVRELWEISSEMPISPLTKGNSKVNNALLLSGYSKMRQIPQISAGCLKIIISFCISIFVRGCLPSKGAFLHFCKVLSAFWIIWVQQDFTVLFRERNEASW